MKKPILLLKKLSIVALIFLTACIETEIIPETLEPILNLPLKSIRLNIGETEQLQAMYTDETNLDRSDLLTWQSNNTNIATVNSSAIVTARATGQTWVVVSAPGNLADSILITVLMDTNVNTVAAVEITVPENSIQVGATIQCAARALNSEGSEIGNPTIVWRSSNSTALSIDANGLATALAPGTTQITAQVDGISSVPFSVEVTPVGGSARMGSFQGNSSYRASGTATLEGDPGSLKVNFSSDFSSSNGPGLGIYLAKNAPTVLTSQNSARLGNLKSTSGAQSYDVPSTVGINDFDFVVIYCEPFNIPFGFARLN